MRYDNLRAFVKHIQSSSPNHLMLLYLLVSKNDHDLSEAIQMIIRSVFPNGKYSKMEVGFFSAENIDFGAFQNELNTISFFAKKRIVILQHAEMLTSSQMKSIQRYFEKPNPQVYFVITAESVGKASEFYKRAEKEGVILDVAEEKSWQKKKNIELWLREKIYKEGRQIEPTALTALIKQLGTDQNLLEQEVNKLYSYMGEKVTITMQDVTAICSVLNIGTVWELGEAVFSFDGAKALNSMKSLLSDGSALIGLLRQLRSQFQTMLQIASILASGKGRDEITHHYRYLTGNILNKKILEAQKYGIHNLKKGILEIDDAELKAKNGMGDPYFLAEILKMKLTTLT